MAYTKLHWLGLKGTPFSVYTLYQPWLLHGNSIYKYCENHNCNLFSDFGYFLQKALSELKVAVFAFNLKVLTAIQRTIRDSFI